MAEPRPRCRAERKAPKTVVEGSSRILARPSFQKRDPNFAGEHDRGVHVVEALCEGGKAVVAILRR